MPFSVTFVDAAGVATTVTDEASLCLSASDPEKVAVDVTPPAALALEVFTDSPYDPTVGSPFSVTLCVNASEPVLAPTATLTGFGPFPPAMVTGGGARWCMGPRVVLAEDAEHVDSNGCISFSVVLADLAGNAAEALTALVNQEGTDLCPATRLALDFSPPVFLWLNLDVVSAEDMVFDVALNEPAEVYFVALPQGSAEPTPEEVLAGTGAGGAAAASRGSLTYVGSDTPSPAAAAGGIGLQKLTVPDLRPGAPYDLYFSAWDRFGQRETEARSRRLSSLGVWTPRSSVEVAEGDKIGDVVALQLTQPPTRDVSVTVTASQPEQLLFALESDALAFAESLTVTFPKDAWSVPIEVKVRAVDDALVEGPHALRVELAVASLDPRYDGSAVEPLRASVLDNDVAAVIISDPREAPQTREMVCDGEVPESVLSYSTTEDVPVDALVWLAGAPSDGDDVTVTLRSGDPSWMAVTGGPTGGAGRPVVLTFNRTNYATQVPVRLIPVYSDVADPDRVVDLVVDVSSSSAPYAAISVPDIPVTIADLQTPGVAFSRVKIRERAGAHVVTMRLESEPRANVVVDFALIPDPGGSHAYASLAIQPASVTFRPEEYGTEKEVTFVTGDDGTYFGDVEFDVAVAFSSVGDAAYANLPPPVLSVVVLEGDPEPAWIVADVSGRERLVAPAGSPRSRRRSCASASRRCGTRSAPPAGCGRK